MKKRGKIFRKRGLSEIVVSLILILLVLVAIGIVWVVVKGILTSESEELSLSKITANLVIEKQNTKVGLKDLTIAIKRNPGKGDISGIKFTILSETGSYEYISDISLEEMESKNYIVPFYPDLTGKIEKVVITPVLISKTGKIIQGINPDEQILTDPYPWRTDSIVLFIDSDENPCTPMGTATTTIDSQRGSVISFDGSWYLSCGNEKYNFGSNDNFTVLFWAKSNIPTVQGNRFAFGNTGGVPAGFYLYGNFFSISDGATSLLGSLCPNNQPPCIDWRDEQWHHLAFSVIRRPSTTSINNYYGGNFINTNTNSLTGSLSNNQNLIIGNSYDSIGTINSVFSFPGSLDEFIIINRSLSNSEIQSIYNLQK